MTNNIMLVDDHEIVRQGMKALLESEKDFKVTASVGSIAEALTSLKQAEPSLILMDIRLPDGSGIEACEKILKQHACRILLLSAFVDKQMALRAVEAGAAGYILKQADFASIIKAIRIVASGRTAFAPEVSEYLVQLVGNEGGLTRTEEEVLALIGEGLSNKEIGQRLHLSEKTVRNYVTKILKKLNLDNRTEAALYWQRENTR